MLEAILLGKKNGFVPGEQPYIGYNFEKGLSTGKQVISLTNLIASDVVTPPVALSGYSKALFTGTKQFPIIPLTSMDVGTGDFTIEFPFYCTQTSNGYTTLMYQRPNTSSWGGLIIRFGDNGYGNRLQVSTQPDIGNSNYSTSTTRATGTNRWIHFVMQRRNGKISVYLNGVKQGLAVFTGSDYSLTERDSLTNIAASTIFQIGDGTASNLYIPEFACYRKARYSANFTPSFPIAA
ncbi:hypothetical protein [Erwinia phage vB_Ea277G]|nr:hypothetical protein [Erwinia phage vB_Ea277G]